MQRNIKILNFYFLNHNNLRLTSANTDTPKPPSTSVTRQPSLPPFVSLLSSSTQLATPFLQIVSWQWSSPQLAHCPSPSPQSSSPATVLATSLSRCCRTNEGELCWILFLIYCSLIFFLIMFFELGLVCRLGVKIFVKLMHIGNWMRSFTWFFLQFCIQLLNKSVTPFRCFVILANKVIIVCVVGNCLLLQLVDSKF